MPSPIVLTFDASVNQQQEQWCRDALAHTHLLPANGSLAITVFRVDEPPCAGHQDYMCTQVDGAGNRIYIRTGAEDPEAPFNVGVKDDIQRFFQESFIHEIGHAFCFNYVSLTNADKTMVGSWFIRTKPTGAAPRDGTLADWNDLTAPWEDRIQEAYAEFFKDVFLPDQNRHFDNRTNWSFKKDSFQAFVDNVNVTICGGGGGGGIG